MASRKPRPAAKPKDRPTVYAIAGPNGAGKTTFATEFLPHFVQCREFLNADLIAAGLAPFAPETQAVRAGRLLLERIEELSRQRATFGVETTLSGRGHVRLLRKLATRGYRRVLFFIWLPTADLAVRRVANRVSQGGHAVPDAIVRRRYASGLSNLFRLYMPETDEWGLYDGRSRPPQRLAHSKDGKLRVRNKLLYDMVRRQAELLDETDPKTG